KCGSGVAANANQCPICFADMEEVGRQQGPAGFQMPTASVQKEEEYMPVVGIPGLDNVRLPEPPPPNYLSPGIGSAPGMGGGGEVRVSLTGEVLEVAAPTARNMPTPGVMPPPGVRPPVGTRPGPPRPTAAPRPMSRRQEDDDILPRQNAGPVAAIVLVLLILGGGAFGGWYWY